MDTEEAGLRSHLHELRDRLGTHAFAPGETAESLRLAIGKVKAEMRQSAGATRGWFFWTRTKSS